MLRLFLTIAIGLTATIFPLNKAEAADQVSLYGRLKVELKLSNTKIPSGNYVEISFDDNDTWVLSDKYGSTIHIPKSSVELIERRVYSTGWIYGTIINRSNVFLYIPDVITHPNTLEQSDIAMTGVNFVDPGKQIIIFAREGNDYLAFLGQYKIRVPISTVRIPDSDDPNSGKLDSVPQLPTSFMGLPLPIFILIAIISFILLVLFYIVWLKRPKPQELTEVQRAVLDRFPPSKIYRVPQWVAASVGALPIEDYPLFNENIDVLWNQMLEIYPEAPKTEPERIRREAEFWERYAKYFSLPDPSGQLFLKPKAEIMDYFKSYEKWVFRDYYAATGIINKTITEEWTRHIDDRDSAYGIKTYGDNSSVSNTQRRQAIEKAEDRLDRFQHETFPAHFEKWSNWFFFHVQDALNKTVDPVAEFGPKTPATPPAHPAHDDLSYRPNA